MYVSPLRNVSTYCIILCVIGIGLTAWGKQPVEDTKLGTAPLIPRDLLFGNPDRTNPEISPDGEHISWLAPHNGVMNIWVAPSDNPTDARPITNDQGAGIQSYQWAYNNETIVFLQDEDGNENWNIFSANIGTTVTTRLTNKRGMRARLVDRSPRFPDEVLVGLNNRNPRLYDIHRLNVNNGKRRLLYLNRRGYRGVISDDNYRVRFMTAMLRDGSASYFKPSLQGDQEVIRIPSEDVLNTSIVGFTKSRRSIYLKDSRDRNTSALVEFDLTTSETTLIASDPQADVSEVLIHPIEKHVQAVAFDYLRKRWEILDENIQADFDFLKENCPGDLSIISRSLDDSKWIIGAQTDQDPEKYYLYNKNDKSITFLFSSRSALEDYQLATMQPVIIKAHDGLDLISYLTLPPNTELNENGRPVQPLPMVLDVHGGPWSRDRWEFTPRHQWLANRGYAVLTVNYRGSSGFGKEFLNAGNREWGGKMHTDLMDGLEWAKTEGIADPERIAIMGGSYGGYAVLWALVESGEHFAAGVGLTGPSNIVTLLEAVPPHLTGMADLFRVRVGDHTTTEGRKLLLSRSPISYPEKISTPLLIAQGANDVRVKRAESDQIVNALVERNIPVTYALFTNEGHGLRRPENRMAFHALTEAFLAQHLGGRHEPLGDILDEASVEILEGSSLIPGIN